MRRILVVAHKTLGGQHLLEEVGRQMKSGECHVHVLVPMNHPWGAFSESSCHAEASKVLEEGMRRLRELDTTGAVDVTGEVGDANPAYAAEVIKNRHETFDEIIVSTLAKSRSAWLRGDMVKKIGRVYAGTPVRHVLGEREPALT
jgi:hypothetical protein